MSRRKKRQQRQAIINFVMVALILAGVGYIVYTLQPTPYDEKTLCLVSDDLPAHTAVIIDKTDEYSAVQAELITDLVRRTSDRLAPNERFTLFELDERGQFDPRGEFSLCNPGRGDQVNPLFSNPRQMEERYAALFEAPMLAALADLVIPKEAPNSPIMEALARLSQTETFSDAAPSRKIVLVSDMLQNSDIFTAYGGGGAMPDNAPIAADSARQIRNRFGRGLDGIEIEIRLIPRERYVDLQRGALRDYWDEVFEELGISARWRDV